MSLTDSAEMAVSSFAQPLRCASPPNVSQLAAATEQLTAIKANIREYGYFMDNPKLTLSTGPNLYRFITAALPLRQF
jgi:hypothetical protein